MDVKIMKTKKCSVCCEDLEMSRFGINRASPDGHNARCKQCFARKYGERSDVKAKREEKRKMMETIPPNHRRCTMCLVAKPYSEFSKCPLTKLGLTAKCKPCMAIVYAEWYSRNREYAVFSNRERKNGGIEIKGKFQATQKEKIRARNALNRAVRLGRIEKPECCEKCDNRDIQAHHYLGYSKEHQFDVKWLCTFHHCEEHRIEGFEERVA